MKRAISGLIQILVVIIGTITFANAQQSQSCDFSKYKPFRLSHFQLTGLIKQVEPKYPPAGKAVRAQGIVRIKVLVDRKGIVQKACALEGHPLLIPASLYAAYLSRFKPNFGLSKAFFKEKQYIADELIYNFVAH